MSACRAVFVGLFLLALAAVGLLASLTSRSLTAAPATPTARIEPMPTPKSEPAPALRPRSGRHAQARVAAESATEPSVRERAVRPDLASTPSVPPAPTLAPAGASQAAEAEADEPDTLRFEINREGIRSAIDSVLPDLQACYEGWLTVGKPVRGKVRVSLRIEADRDDPQRGVITGAEVLDSELHHPLIEACLLNALSQPEFDPPPDGGKVMVTYPLLFDDEEPE